MKDPGNPKIHELNRRVVLCSQDDVVVNATTMELKRTGVVWAWARIKSHYGLPSYVSAQSDYTVMDPRTKATHAITVRSGIGVLVTNKAFVYEEFRKSPPRWYKVLGYSEPEGFLVMTCRMIERSDFAIPPQGDIFAPQPIRFEL
jgi:hypothetical protein